MLLETRWAVRVASAVFCAVCCVLLRTPRLARDSVGLRRGVLTISMLDRPNGVGCDENEVDAGKEISCNSLSLA